MLFFRSPSHLAELDSPFWGGGQSIAPQPSVCVRVHTRVQTHVTSEGHVAIHLK